MTILTPSERGGFYIAMATSLYQKYRPQQFSDLVNQAHVRTTLLNELKSGTVSHAYLFSGPRGVGKTTTARLLARAVNCESLNDGEPCNRCDSCKMIAGAKALDVMEVDAASHTGVDNVRENIIDNARVAPSGLLKKVFIIDEVHMLSTSAFNALLKTLEEPPEHALFILATTEIHKLPATIVSRCERFQFRKIGYTEMEGRLRELARLEGVKVHDDVLTAIAKSSEGALRDAESLLGQVLALDEKEVDLELASIVLPHSDLNEVIGFWEEVVRGQLTQAVQRINRLRDEGVMLPEFIKELVDFLRKVLLYTVQDSLAPLEYLDVSKDEVARIGQLASGLTPPQLVEMIDVFLNAQDQQKSALIPQLPLELAVVRLVGDGANRSVAKPSASQPTSPEPDASQPSGPAVDEPKGEVAQPDPVESEVSELKNVDSQPKGVAGEEKGTDGVREETKSAPPDTTQEPPAQASGGAIALTIEKIQAQWNDLLEEMKRLNHALHLTMKVAHVVSVQENTLTIGFEYKFYQDRLNDAHNRPVIDEAFQNVFGRPVILETVVGPEYKIHSGTAETNIEQPSEDEVSNVWELASSTFGGEAAPQAGAGE